MSRSKRKQSRKHLSGNGQNKTRNQVSPSNTNEESLQKTKSKLQEDAVTSTTPAVKEEMAPKRGFFARLIESIKSLLGSKKLHQENTEEKVAVTDNSAIETPVIETSVIETSVIETPATETPATSNDSLTHDEPDQKMTLNNDDTAGKSEEGKQNDNKSEEENSDLKAKLDTKHEVIDLDNKKNEEQEKSQTLFYNLKENLKILGISALDDVKSWADINEVAVNSLTSQIEKLKYEESQAKAEADAKFKTEHEELCKAVKTFFKEQDIKNASSIEEAIKFLKEYLKDMMKNQFNLELKEEDLKSDSLYDLLQVFFDKVEALVKEISNERNEADQASAIKENTISQKEELIKKLEGELSTAKTENETLKATDAAKLLEEFEALKKEHQNLQQEKDILQQSFNEQLNTITANDSKIEDLTNKVGDLTDEINELKNNIDTLENDKANIIADKNNLDVAKKDLENQIKGDKEKYDNEIKQKKQRIDEQQTKISEQEGMISSKENEIKKLETDKANLTAEKNNLNKVIENKNDVIKDKEAKQKAEISDFMQQINGKVKEIGDSISIPGYIIPCTESDEKQSETLEEKVKDSFEVFKKNFESFNKDLEKNAKTNEELKTRLQKMMEMELNEPHSWINQLAIYYAYCRIPFMTGSKRNYGMQLDRKAMTEIYSTISDMLGLLSMSLQLPLLFVEKVGEGRYEDVTGKEYSDLDNFCANSRNHLDQVDTDDRSNIIVDIAEVGYSKDGKIVKQTKIMH